MPNDRSTRGLLFAGRLGSPLSKGPRPGRLRRLLSSPVAGKKISVVVVVHNEKQYLERTLRSLQKSLPSSSEIVVVDDQSTDNGCDFLLNGRPSYGSVSLLRTPVRLGVSQARNFGASQCRGDILVFSDAHIEVPEDWVSRFSQALARPEVGAVTPAINALDDPESASGYGMGFSTKTLDIEWLGKTEDEPYPVPLMCGCFFGIRRAVFDELAGFDSGMVLWGSEDLELSLHVWAQGYECRVIPKVTVAHRFASSFRYPVEWQPLYNRLRMAAVHLGNSRLLHLLAQSEEDGNFALAWERLLSSDVWLRRTTVRSRRAHDDDWYFARFAPHL